jgi:hypothetical protein
MTDYTKKYYKYKEKYLKAKNDAMMVGGNTQNQQLGSVNKLE